MASANPKFKHKVFDDPRALELFVTNASSTVATVVSVVADASGKYILFYVST